MGFFDDLPAPQPMPLRRHHPWEPPEAELPGIVPIDTLLLARTDQVAVAVTGLSAFSAGIKIFLTARIRPSADHPEEHLAGGPRDLAASRCSFRFGLQFSDGSKATGSPGVIDHPVPLIGTVAGLLGVDDAVIISVPDVGAVLVLPRAPAAAWAGLREARWLIAWPTGARLRRREPSPWPAAAGSPVRPERWKISEPWVPGRW